MLTSEQLKAIKERAEKATPGPWEIDTKSPGSAAWPAVVIAADGEEVATTHQRPKGLRWYFEGSYPDAPFIAHAITDIPALLSHIEEVEKERDDAVNELQRINDLPIYMPKKKLAFDDSEYYEDDEE